MVNKIEKENDIYFFKSYESRIIAHYYRNHEKVKHWESRKFELIPINAFFFKTGINNGYITVIYEFSRLLETEIEGVYITDNNIADDIRFDLPEIKLSPKRALKQALGIDFYTRKYIMSIFVKEFDKFLKANNKFNEVYEIKGEK